MMSSSLLAQVTQVVWGTSALGIPILTSDGSELSLDDFSIEIGSFMNGFNPVSASLEDLVSNFDTFDAITESDSDSGDFFESGLLPGTQSFAGQAGLLVDPITGLQVSDSEDALAGSEFGAGEQVFIFIRNSDQSVLGSEFLLITGQGFQLPTASGGQAGALPVSFDISQADQVLFGSANGINGGGFQSFSNGGVGLQTFAVVPEPGSLFLLGMGLAALGLGSRRRGKETILKIS